MALPTKAPEQIVLFWTYNTPNVAMMTMAISFDRQSLQASLWPRFFFLESDRKKGENLKNFCGIYRKFVPS